MFLLKKYINSFFNPLILQKGQGLLIVVLVMVVALTVGLSVAIRTTTNLRTSTEGENSERAFSAAEAGIEQSSITSSSVPLTNLANSSSYQTDVTQVSGSEFNLNNGTIVMKDEPVDVWLSNTTFTTSWTGTLEINWGNTGEVCDSVETNNTQAALEIVVISGTKANPNLTTYLVDSCAARASSSNAELVSTSGSTINGTSYFRRKQININSGLLVRIIPLYASTTIGVQKAGPDPLLPSQGNIITATGTADNTKRKIVAFKGNPKLPAELFPFLLFSPK